MKLSLQPLMTRMSTSMLRPFAAACLVAVASLAWTGWASAAECAPGPYELTTQAKVDALGATGFDCISAYLSIAGKNITNLDGLANLTSVGGKLVIEFNPALTNLDGLANLTSVGGKLSILRNNAITNLDGLANLTSVGGNLYIYGNDALTNLDGLANLTSVGFSLHIQLNNALTNLDGLVNLTSVGDFLYINRNDALTNLDGLANLTSVGGYLDIEGNDALTNLDGLANLTSVEWFLRIYRNDALTNLDGLANLTSVGGLLAIGFNPALTNLDGLANLTSVGDLLISGNDNASCEGLALLLGWPSGPPDDDVDGDITIASNGSGCNSIAEVLASYNPPLVSDRFNALLQAVQAIRGAGSNQQTQATSESSAGADVARQLAKEEGATVQARAIRTTGEPESIPAMPYYLMLMMTCLVGLFGLRQFRA
jgi:hypothetical protein